MSILRGALSGGAASDSEKHSANFDHVALLDHNSTVGGPMLGNSQDRGPDERRTIAIHPRDVESGGRARRQQIDEEALTVVTPDPGQSAA